VNKKIDVAIVSYLNTLPFIHGFQHTQEGKEFNLILATPRDCASLFIENKVDIALIPVAVLTELKDNKIISDFCIGCDGKVRTVCLFYKNDIDDLDEILLDTHSRTSILLIQILMEKYFHKKVKYIPSDINENIEISNNQAILAIGDKVFDIEKKYKHKIDLGEAWKEWTNLPFAFAVFIAKSDVSYITIQKLNAAITYGIENISELNLTEYSSIDSLENYLKNNISYALDTKKMKALGLYLEYLKERE
jgi:chorismate dehydratase